MLPGGADRQKCLDDEKNKSVAGRSHGNANQKVRAYGVPRSALAFCARVGTGETRTAPDCSRPDGLTQGKAYAQKAIRNTADPAGSPAEDRRNRLVSFVLEAAGKKNRPVHLRPVSPGVPPADTAFDEASTISHVLRGREPSGSRSAARRNHGRGRMAILYHAGDIYMVKWKAKARQSREAGPITILTSVKEAKVLIHRRTNATSRRVVWVPGRRDAC